MGVIENFSDYFTVQVASDKMLATLLLKKEYHLELSCSKGDLIETLNAYHISWGLKDDSLQVIASGAQEDQFPIVVAEGIHPQHGIDGKIQYEKELSQTFTYDEKVNFRDVIKIPSVHAGDALLTILNPTNGKPGKNVTGEEIPPKPGRSVLLRPGQNVEWKKSESRMYSTSDGQLSVGDRSIHVYPLYEVHGDVSMRTGNIEFVGSVVIRGNVPTGYTIKATGDVTIYGLLEGSTVEAGGSVYISEGIAGHGKGSVRAGVDIKCGYINQGKIEAGRDLFVENSVLHSDVIARKHIYCQKGNIIGGALSAGSSIEAKDIGNKMNTPTQIYVGSNKKLLETQQELEFEKDQLMDTLHKLSIIGDKLLLKQENSGLSGKERITLLRQRNSYEQTYTRLQVVQRELEALVPDYEDGDQAYLLTHGTLFAYVTIAFGKYQRRESRNYTKAKATFKDGEVLIQSMEDHPQSSVSV
ncbi:DUF342 domain-containing protein [Pontibacillus salipaludis]|uniref:Flagellar Assembly Protein A N-terminal region domain-containing protein n=1 Tax=Pontibacillus salipaludis TaxID=1697394 RepID=A0ABQ1PGY3_9BACI|nr:FapA family protein [Pontibacillus salipaludis]GGC97143.1 hypothetical protein GCM10011389_00340 [Pontibacillus salipaludis]